MKKKVLAVLAIGALVIGTVPSSRAADPGVTDTEITIGQSLPYSGPASAYSGFGKSETAYMRMINDKGGINGRKINLISLDDSYLPPKAVEQTRKLVEQEGVFFNFSTIGTASNVAIRKYLNDKKVPQVFAASGLVSFGDHKRFPWTIAWQPPFEIEGQLFVRYILKEKPNARIALLYQNDDLGRDYVRGIQRELGDKAATTLVAMQSYEITDPTIDSQMVKLQQSGADAFINISTPKFAALSIRKA